MSDRPKRIQRKRERGWKMPSGAIYVGRPTKFGNPFAIGTWVRPVDAMPLPFRVRDATQATALYAAQFYDCPATQEAIIKIRTELGGHDLACWCAIGQPCHADVLLELANPEPTPER